MLSPTTAEAANNRISHNPPDIFGEGCRRYPFAATDTFRPRGPPLGWQLTVIAERPLTA